ncbi:MAG: lamin tail domain-containing protein, partial [Tannerella sp.]|nr:lamin tail domain-containing protein [Tannerella sp.]
MSRGLLFFNLIFMPIFLWAQDFDRSNHGDVLINEVMANPVGLTMLPETEYVEIYNISNNDLSLNGWVFVYDGKETALPDVVLLSGGYAVLYRSGRDIMVAEGALSLGIDKFPSALANTSKTIGLKNSKGEMIDEITYPNATAGKSYER